MTLDSSPNDLGMLIAQMRRRRKLTQQELADSVGMSRGSIGNIEAGEDRPSLATLQKICDHLQFSLRLSVTDRVPYCQCCGTTEGLHRDYGSGGPYRCDSPDCQVF